MHGVKITSDMLDPEDRWSLKEPLSSERLKQARDASVEFLAEQGHVIDRGFTCDDCKHAPKCTLAFDGYNTDGDCLYSK